jgi:inhibitor of the pro-sigma K processing machinery
MDRVMIIGAWILGILIILALGKAFVVPMKLLLRLLLNGLFGGIAILVINLIGGLIGFTIPLNIVSAFIAGILGLPGIILLVILKFLL